MFLPVVITFLLGLSIGSFANVCIYRIPLGISILDVPSRCPRCSSQLSWFELIPVASFVFLRGQCSHCTGRIAFKYPITELLFGGLSTSLLLHFGLNGEFLTSFVFISVMILIALIDWAHFVIPNRILMVASVAVVFLFTWFDVRSLTLRFVSASIATAIMASILFLSKKIFKKDALGAGDVKLSCLLGFFLSWEGFFITLWLGSVLGACYGLTRRLVVGPGYDPRLPFGSFLAITSSFVFVFSPQIHATIFSWLNQFQ